MRSSVMSMILLVTASTTVGAEDVTAVTATAHNPQYSNQSLWPAELEADKAAYAQEAWPDAPVLVWSSAAEMKEGKQSRWRVKIDADTFDDPANWRQEDGRAATKGPDEFTDVVFPEGTQISIECPVLVRHVTLQPGSSVGFGRLEHRGNLWIQKGAHMGFTHGHFGAPDKDTFMRSDNEDMQMIANYVRYRKRPEKGVEFIGKWKMGDQIFPYSGHIIIGPGSVFQHTDRFELRLHPEATLVLLSGATWEARGNYYHKNDIIVQGRLLAGLPQRPLTSNCTLGLSFKAHGVCEYLGQKYGSPTDVGLLLMPEGVLSVHSSIPAEARLVFRFHRHPCASRAWGRDKDHRDVEANWNEPPELAAMPHGIILRLFGEVNFDGVVFNDVIKGGIQIPEPAAADKWRNISLGTGNFGSSLSELVSSCAGYQAKF